jgi:DNA-binding NarL/FixJ family response regulator
MGQAKEKKPSTPHVAIADDHELFRKIYSLTLESAGMDVCCTVSTGKQLVDTIQKHKHDILLLDIAMPEMDGLAALTILKYLAPEIPILVISYMTDPTYMDRALELGADGYLSKGVSPTELISVIEKLLSGERLHYETSKQIDPPAPSIPGMAFPKEEPKSPEVEFLTDQERLILSLIAMGNDNQSILDTLHISKNTLKTHTRNLFAKLGVNDRTQAAIWAFQNGYHFESIEVS